ncbi:alpha-2,8-polysialyltransferase family protein [Salipiger thiooxidans]|uniref:alpha-2,8-polysialyltransferase family protein n=1 Tax=Salipiger thiooxidans TaxID=282683 RepID=UPI001CD72367|nr:alpha-2,8-polysialyltransferase family protein [Salipiger thiooxidans]MCA0849988.1 alpha-2,8-polysialyltransferase family protein [Salipiger thiooxidans]
MLVCEISTKFGLYSLMTLLGQDDTLPPAAERVLLVSTHTPDPEARDALLEFARTSPHVAKTFSKVLSLNAILAPQHPTQWKPPADELDALAIQSMLRAIFGAAPDERVDLMMESIQTPPSNTLARIMTGSDVYLYSDGLMTYGPTRFELPYPVASRIRRLYYMDFVPGLKPSLLREYGVETRAVAPAALRETLEALSTVTKADLDADGLDGAPVFLGQYLSGLNLCTPEEEVELYAQALNICSLLNKGNGDTVFFKPHPTFSTGLLHALKTSPRLRNFDLRILDTGPLMEEFLMHYRPAFIASVFSTGLATAREMFGIEAYSYDTLPFLQRLKPYENSNRVPAALIHYGFPEIASRRAELPLETLQAKIDLLSAGMQPKLLARTEAEKAALLALPEEPEDPIESAARARIAKLDSLDHASFRQCAIRGRRVEASKLYPEVQIPAPVTVSAPVPAARPAERPLDKAERLLAEGDAAEAFFISFKALRKTPGSTRHMKVLGAASETLGGLYRRQYDEIRPLHEAALAATGQVPAPAAPAPNPAPAQAAAAPVTPTAAPAPKAPPKPAPHRPAGAPDPQAGGERALDKAERLLAEGQAAEAFEISYQALESTPTSSRHMKIVETAAKSLGGRYRERCDRIRPQHEAAVREKKGSARRGPPNGSGRPSFWKKLRS